MKLKKKKQLLEELKTIPDFRVDKYKILYPLNNVLFMTLFALLKGATHLKRYRYGWNMLKTIKYFIKCLTLKI